MGYDVWIQGEVTLKRDKVDEALTALRAKAFEEDDEPCDETLDELIFRFSHEHFEATEDKLRSGEWSIGPVEDSHRDVDEAEDLFKLLAPYLNDGTIFFEGEDGDEWSWEIKDGKLGYDRADQVWGDDKGKIEAFDAVLKILYPKGKLRTRFPKGTLDKLADTIRKAGYGPLAGLDDLDAIAKASAD